MFVTSYVVVDPTLKYVAVRFVQLVPHGRVWSGAVILGHPGCAISVSVKIRNVRENKNFFML